MKRGDLENLHLNRSPLICTGMKKTKLNKPKEKLAPEHVPVQEWVRCMSLVPVQSVSFLLTLLDQWTSQAENKTKQMKLKDAAEY